MKNNQHLFRHLLLLICFVFISNLAFSQESSCDKSLNNAIKLYNARDYQNAKKAFEIGQKNCENKKVFQDWIKKCDDNLKGANKPESQEKQNTATPAKPSTQSKPDKPVKETKPAHDKDYYNATLEVPLFVEFTSAKETKEFEVITNYRVWDYDYGSSTGHPWITFKKNPTSLSVTCEENKSLRDRREYISVNAGYKTERVEIIQRAKKDLFPVVRNLILSNLSSNNTIHSKSNQKYKGEKTATGHRNGLGAQLWANGNFYFGVFTNGECTNGIFVDGDLILLARIQSNKYQVGTFYDSKLNGEGKTYSDEGVLTYKGEFNNDEPAYGNRYWRDNPHPEFRFDIIQDQFGYYFGETLNGEPHGKGVFIHVNKDMWYGDWSYGKRSAGIEIKLDGEVKVGTEFEAWDESVHKLQKKKQSTELTQSLLTTKIFFEPNEDMLILDEEQSKKLARAAEILKENAQYSVTISGYALQEETGDIVDLARRRATTVKRFFINQGVPEKQLTVQRLNLDELQTLERDSKDKLSVTFKIEQNRVGN